MHAKGAKVYVPFGREVSWGKICYEYLAWNQEDLWPRSHHRTFGSEPCASLSESLVEIHHKYLSKVLNHQSFNISAIRRLWNIDSNVDKTEHTVYNSILNNCLVICSSLFSTHSTGSAVFNLSDNILYLLYSKLRSMKGFSYLKTRFNLFALFGFSFVSKCMLNDLLLFSMLMNIQNNQE